MPAHAQTSGDGPQPGRLRDRVALVTGGASGIGASCARRLAAEGAVVVVADLDEDGATRVARQITAASGTALPRRIDVTDPDSVTRVVTEAATLRDGLQIAVNSAGINGPLSPLAELPPADFDTVMRVNLYGVFHAMRCQLPAMAATGGVIVNLASIAAHSGFRGHAAYAAAKQGVLALTRTAARECSRPRHPGRVGITRNRRHPNGHLAAARSHRRSPHRRPPAAHRAMRPKSPHSSRSWCPTTPRT